jgi:probable O-glycosylation ligase (exosortase A-associated)
MLRDLLLATVTFGSLPFCFLRPWIGILVWSWIGYMNPHRLTWGFLYSMPIAQIVALATIAGIPLSKERSALPRTAEVFFLSALWGLFLLSTLFAIYPESAWIQLDKVSKILFMTFLTLILFQDPRKLRILLWVIALSVGFFGLKGGIWAVLSGGQNQVLGPPGSFIEGNTEIGLALIMVLPILLFLSREAPRPWLRYPLHAMCGCSIIAILFTYSRGAFIGLGTILVVFALKSRVKVVALLLLIVVPYVAAPMLPEKWFNRMETIKTYEQDQSAVGRLVAWHVAYQLALDHPLLGAGFRPFTREIFQQYDQPNSKWEVDAHSIFFQILGEHGFTGLALYVGLILSTMMSLRRIIWLSRQDPAMRWMYHCAQMLETALIGYLVAGAFLSMSYFDLFYHLVAITILLKQLALLQEKERVGTPGYAGNPAWPVTKVSS